MEESRAELEAAEQTQSEIQQGTGGSSRDGTYYRNHSTPEKRENFPQLTHFSHHSQALLVIGTTSSNKDGDLMFF